MAQNLVLELEHISKTIDQLTILDDISLSFREGEKVALIGPSGAGKTTLLNIIANILKPDRGSLRIGGNDARLLLNRKEYGRSVGVIRQQFDLVGQLPVIHNVLAGRLNQWGTLRSLWSLIVPQDRHLAESALERVGILDKLYEKTANLSGGEQQRVALARLLVQNPRIILADEPVSSLDPARTRQVLELMVKLTEEENQTLIVSLHSTEFIESFFTRVIAVKSGRIFFDMASKDLKAEDLKAAYAMGAKQA